MKYRQLYACAASATHTKPTNDHLSQVGNGRLRKNAVQVSHSGAPATRPYSSDPLSASHLAQTVASTSRVIDPAAILPSGREATNCSVQMRHIVCPPMANEPRIGTEP